MSKIFIFRTLLWCFVSFALFTSTSAQSETLSNGDIVLMNRAGLSKDLIIRKLKESGGKYDTSVEALIELKKSGVPDEIISLMMEKTAQIELNAASTNELENRSQKFQNSNSHILLKPKEALSYARTIALEKSSIHPSRQALEKELLKRDEWKDLNLNIVRYKDAADLYVEIGYVSLSWITHRYVWRVYDNKSGTVIAAGETTSWGSLAKNLAREIAKNLKTQLKQ